MSAVLEVTNIKKSFGGITAVDGVSFDVREGEILGLIGPNGCGKSTLFNCILGQLTPTAGEVKVDGRAVTGMRPSELNRLGVSRTFQLLQVFPKLSVRENLILAGQEHQGNMMSRLFGRSDAGLTDVANQMIGFFKLDHLAGEQAGSLSYGQQKLLDAAMAFMGGPRLVLLDEPAGGVNPSMLADLKDRLVAINHEKRATFVVIEHNMEFVMSLCSRVMVMAEGKVLATILNGTTFSVPRAAITTVIGPNGAGKSTVFKAIFGLLKLREGKIVFRDNDVTGLSQRALLNAGICYVPQGRNIFPELSVRHNIELGGVAAERGIDLPGRIEAALDLFPALRRKSAQQASTLSGGEQKQLEIARSLLLDPQLVLIDEPSIGLSPLMVQQTFKILQDLRDRGVSILMIEQNARSALEISDHAIVLELGQTRLADKADRVLHDPRIGQLFLGGAMEENAV